MTPDQLRRFEGDCRARFYRSDTQPEQSYPSDSSRDRARSHGITEILVVQKLTGTESLKVIETQLQKGPHRGKPRKARKPISSKRPEQPFAKNDSRRFIPSLEEGDPGGVLSFG
jgi:hypothetical protein